MRRVVSLIDMVATYLMRFNPIEIKYLVALISSHLFLDLSFNYPQNLIVYSNED